MLHDWQIALLDQGLWLVPTLGVLALAVFPWKHWNSLFDEIFEVHDESR